MKRLLQKYSSKKTTERNAKFKNLQEHATNLQRKLDAGDTSVLPEIEITQNAIQTLLTYKANGEQVRTRRQWAEEGEKPSNFFLNMEKHRARTKLISAVYRPDGSLTNNLSDIILSYRNFYQNLFSHESLDIQKQDHIIAQLERCLSDADANTCEGLLTRDECHNALKGLARGKTPGIDGLPVEFYIAYWDILGNDFVDAANSSYHDGLLSPTQRQGVITLLYKKGDQFDAKNWRPISLLCTDYKTIARALVNRLTSVIAQVVSPDQTCGIPGRFMGENLALLRDIVHYTSNNNLPAVILSLDQEKAFDRVEWPFLHRVLAKMGFGSSFLKWIKIMYTDVRSAIQINGYQSNFFPVSRGVRQGCPLSPLLYVLVAEAMACAIRADSSIAGFPLPGSSIRVKISQYADDTTLIVDDDTSLTRIFHVLEDYSKASGAKLNLTKCVGLWLGSWRHRKDSPVSIRWSSTNIQVLGAALGPDITPDQRWDPLISKIETSLAPWAKRTLSFSGKTTVLNCLVLSRLWYMLAVFDIPPRTLTKINALITSFFWSSKSTLIARTTLELPRPRGGFGLRSIAFSITALRAVWMRRYARASPGKWTTFFNHYLRRAFLASPVDRVFAFKTHTKESLERLPSFYRGLLVAWQRLGGNKTADGSLTFETPSSHTPVTHLTTGIAYKILINNESQPPRCETKLRLNHWPAVWQSIHLCRYIRPTLDSVWKMAHDVLPTADRLICYGMNVSKFCFCGALETADHLLFQCSIATRVWFWFSFLAHKYRQDFPLLSTVNVRFGYPRTDAVPKGFQVLTHIIKHQLWLHRNCVRFDSLAPDYNLILVRIKAIFCFHLRIQLRHTNPSEFTSSWLAMGTFGFLTPEKNLIFSESLKY